MYRTLALIFSLWLVAVGPANAQTDANYPSRLVTIIVPVAAGGATDVVTRIIANQLSQKWGQTVIVKNVPGGAMNIGARQAAEADPDGYTLLVTPPATVTYNRLLFKHLGYEPENFTPISVLTKTPLVLLVRSSLEVKTVDALVAYAKKNVGKVTFGSAGVGTTLHLAAVRFEQREGLKMVHVPYRGESLALKDLIGGQIDIVFGTLSSALPIYRSGKVKMLAVAQEERNGVVPNVPTMIEAGVSGFVSSAWYALVAPPKLPKQIQQKINRDVTDILRDPVVEKRLESMILQPAGGSVEETSAFFASESKLWGDAIKAAKIEPR